MQFGKELIRRFNKKLRFKENAQCLEEYVFYIKHL